MSQNREALRKLLNEPMDYPEVLDDLWGAYMDTKQSAFVVKIASVLDWEDRTREHFATWLQNSSTEERMRYTKKLAEWSFPIDCEEQTLGGPVDLDIHVAILVKYGQLKFDELPIQIPARDLVHLSMKSAALSSLLSMSGQDPNVAEICVRQSKVKGGAGRSHLAHATDIANS